MTQKSAPQDTPLGSPASKRGAWVQTDRKAHEGWARLIARKPRAAELLHHLVANMANQNAVVIPQSVLAKMMGRSVDTVQRAIKDLVSERWITVVRLGRGKEAAYVVNDQVAWGQKRAQLCLSTFSATVVADAEDQDDATLTRADLRRIPAMYPGEQQLPTGGGEPPPSQPSFETMEPDLPAIVRDENGRAWEVDQRTGEVQRRIEDAPSG